MVSRHPLYERLLKLYPKSYRDKYGEQMAQTLSDMLADQPSKAAQSLTRLRAIIDLPVHVVQQNVMVVGDTLMNETPAYIKRNSIIGGVLLAPFCLVVASGVLQNQQLMNTRAWVALASVALLVLPGLGFVLNASSYIKWFFDKSIQKKRGIFSRLLDVSHTWPMVLAGGIGLLLFLFVPFHDSVHCVAGNPVRVAHNPNQAWQCINNGFLGGK